MSTLLSQNRFFVNQKIKLIELTNEFKIRDEAGTEIGTIKEEGQSKLKKLARFTTNLDSMMTHKYGIHDADGTRVAALIRPRAIMFSKVLVQDGSGAGGREPRAGTQGVQEGSVLGHGNRRRGTRRDPGGELASLELHDHRTRTSSPWEASARTGAAPSRRYSPPPTTTWSRSIRASPATFASCWLRPLVASTPL